MMEDFITRGQGGFIVCLFCDLYVPVLWIAPYKGHSVKLILRLRIYK
jgi:hypothetical protein